MYSDHERQRAERRSPDDPAQLPARGDRPQPRERAHHQQQPAEQAHAEIRVVAAARAARARATTRAPCRPAGDERHAADAEQERRQVQHRQHGAAEIGLRPTDSAAPETRTRSAGTAAAARAARPRPPTRRSSRGGCSGPLGVNASTPKNATVSQKKCSVAGSFGRRSRTDAPTDDRQNPDERQRVVQRCR